MISVINKSLRQLATTLALLSLCVLLASSSVLAQDPKENSTQIHTGVFRASAADSNLLMRQEWNAFLSQWQALEGKGYRMDDFETYTEGSKRLYAGVFGKGTDAKGAIVGQEWAAFHA